jgi:hypothetical protein
MKAGKNGPERWLGWVAVAVGEAVALGLLYSGLSNAGRMYSFWGMVVLIIYGLAALALVKRNFYVVLAAGVGMLALAVLGAATIGVFLAPGAFLLLLTAVFGLSA